MIAANQDILVIGSTENVEIDNEIDVSISRYYGVNLSLIMSDLHYPSYKVHGLYSWKNFFVLDVVILTVTKKIP